MRRPRSRRCRAVPSPLAAAELVTDPFTDDDGVLMPQTTMTRKPAGAPVQRKNAGASDAPTSTTARPQASSRLQDDQQLAPRRFGAFAGGRGGGWRFGPTDWPVRASPPCSRGSPARSSRGDVSTASPCPSDAGAGSGDSSGLGPSASSGFFATARGGSGDADGDAAAAGATPAADAGRAAATGRSPCGAVPSVASYRRRSTRLRCRARG